MQYSANDFKSLGYAVRTAVVLHSNTAVVFEMSEERRLGRGEE